MWGVKAAALWERLSWLFEMGERALDEPWLTLLCAALAALGFLEGWPNPEIFF